VAVRFTGPATLHLQFADRRFDLDAQRLDMPMDRIRWPTAAVLPSGTGMTVTAIKGETITIDSGTLRCLVDIDYARMMQGVLESLQLSRAELDELAKDSQPPQGLPDEPEDLRLESWK